MLTTAASAQVDDKDDAPSDDVILYEPYVAYKDLCPTAKSAWQDSRYKGNDNLRKKGGSQRLMRLWVDCLEDAHGGASHYLRLITKGNWSHKQWLAGLETRKKDLEDLTKDGPSHLAAQAAYRQAKSDLSSVKSRSGASQADYDRAMRARQAAWDRMALFSQKEWDRRVAALDNYRAKLKHRFSQAVYDQALLKRNEAWRQYQQGLQEFASTRNNPNLWPHG